MSELEAVILQHFEKKYKTQYTNYYEPKLANRNLLIGILIIGIAFCLYLLINLNLEIDKLHSEYLALKAQCTSTNSK